MNTPAPLVSAGPPIASLPLIASGTLTLWQFYDIGNAIDLDRARACLAASVVLIIIELVIGLLRS